MNNITETWKNYRNRKATKFKNKIADLENYQEVIDREPKRIQRVMNNPKLFRSLQDKRTVHTVRRGYGVRGEPVNYDNSVRGILSFHKNADTSHAFGLSTSLHQKAEELPNLVRMGVVDANTPNPKNPQLGKKVLQRIQKISRILQRYTPTKFEGGNNGLQGN
jgi:hypothetical protein